MKNLGLLYESILIKKMQKDDKSAFSILFTAYFADLVMFSITITRDKNSAEEIVQEVFVSLWEDRNNIEISRSFKSYLLKSVQNRSINWLNHKKIRHAYAHYVIENIKNYENTTESYLLYSELLEKVEKALNLLPQKVSEAFRKNRFEGLTYKEIADIQGVSERTIEVRIGKALRLLRDHLRDYFIIGLFIVASFHY